MLKYISILFDLHFPLTIFSPMIIGEIRRYLRDDGIMKVSRSLKNTAYQTSKVREMLTYRYGREPTLDEISAEAGIAREEIIMAMEASADMESLQKSVYQSDSSEIYLEDKVEDKKDSVNELVNHILLESMMKQLEAEEKQLIQMRYYDEMTQTQVAKELNKTQVQISRLEKKILKKMRLCIKE